MFEIIDLHFQGQPQVIAAYVFRGPGGAVLIETGPGSTLPQLEAGLTRFGLGWEDIGDILLTHIHLDHAGAAGWIARRSGARVHVHHLGAPHLADPSRLLASAQRIYGEMMAPLWGEFLAVPAGQLHILHDNDVVEAAGRRFVALDTPGHAYHHMAYLSEGLCFSGDVAGVCLPGCAHTRLPTPPPEFDLPAWKTSLARLRRLRPDQLLLTHFGPVAADAQAHLRGVEARLDEVTDFIYGRWQAGATETEMVEDYVGWMAELATAEGCDPATVRRYEVAVPLFMAIPGLVRYFTKTAAPQKT